MYFKMILLLVLCLLCGCGSSDSVSGASFPQQTSSTVALTPDIRLLIVNQTQTYQLTVNNQDVTAQAIWSSDDPAVAQVVSPGVFRGISAGKTILRATLSGNSGGVEVSVAPEPPAPPPIPR